MGVIAVFDLVLTIENVVMIGAFSEGIDLRVAHQRLASLKCNWQKSSGLSVKLNGPPATFLLFKNGKFVCTGTKTKTKGKQAIIHLLNLLKTENLVSKNCGFECCVKNLVASANLSGASVPLEQLTNEFETLYDPEKFPPIYKTNKPQATLLICLTGKLICSGITDEEALNRLVKKFYTQLVEEKTIEKTLSPSN